MAEEVISEVEEIDDLEELMKQAAKKPACPIDKKAREACVMCEG